MDNPNKPGAAYLGLEAGGFFRIEGKGADAVHFVLDPKTGDYRPLADAKPPMPAFVERMKAMGISDPTRVYDTNELAPGKKIIFAATGVTDGTILRGVRFFGTGKRTQSLIMTTETRHVRFIDTVHVEGGPDSFVRFDRY